MAASPTEGQRYLLADGLGSIRHAADDAASVAVYQEFDPYGVPLDNGGDPYGYTGEWWADEVDLLHLRARWYAPADGIFLSRDPLQSEPPYQYVRGNPVNLIDPSGFNSEPEIPSQSEWTSAGGLSWEYSLLALDRLVSLRSHVVAAAQRHSFVPQQICTASSSQYQLLYTLGAIIYRESLGYDEEGPPQTWVSLFGANFSIGIAQIRPNTTAREIEEAQLLYNPGTLEEPLTTTSLFEPPLSFSDRVYKALGRDIDIYSRNRVAQLLDPIWAIEYAAGNMDLARSQNAYTSNPQYPGLGRPMAEWEKMAAWYNTGIINVEDVDIDLRDEFWNSRLQPYLVGTFAAMQAIENLDLLDVRSKCSEDCE